ncbi:MAG TPA: alpha/beta fold hydrolase [bacterium]|nr:alpha/beta fold hydrolase [bacterium]
MKKIVIIILALLLQSGVLFAELKFADLQNVFPANLKNKNIPVSNFIVEYSSKYNNDVQIDSVYYYADNLKIYGLLYRPVKKKIIAGIVIAHGYYPPESYYQGQGTLSTGIKLAESGFITIVPDYRGYYKSQGGASYPYPGESIDVISAAKTLKIKYDLNKIYLIGYSWGGGIAATAAEISDMFNKLVLYYPQLGGVEINQREFSALKNNNQVKLTGREILDFFKGKSPLYNCSLINIPVLIFHGKKDVTVKLEQPEKLVELMKRSGKKVEMIVYDEYGHAFADGPDNKSWNKLVSFLKQ